MSAPSDQPDDGSFTEEALQYQLLVVDDNPVNLSVVADYLQEHGFRVLTARDGESALERVRYVHPDLILLDVMMPGLDGFEVCRRLKAEEQTRDVPVIFMTALSSPSEKLQGFAAGAVDYVTKPLYREEVLARVQTHLQIQDLTRRLRRKNLQLEASHQEIRRFNAELEHMVQRRTEELDQAYRLLERLDRTKSDFIKVAAHELRTPLTLIKGYAQLLSGMVGEQPEAEELLEGILTGHERLHEVVSMMLDISRIDTQALTVVAKPTDLNVVLRRVLADLEPSTARRRLTFELSALEQVPDPIVDADLMYKLFYQLIVNAVKYTPDGGTITVSGKAVAAEAGGPGIEVLVRDTGVGIDPEHHALIFNKFYQTGPVSLHSTGRTSFKGGGPGLGLAIARGIVQAHRGRIWVESPGHDEARCPGSTFHVFLPAAPPGDSAAPAA